MKALALALVLHGSNVVTSNVTREDYAGSEACAACHPKIADAWRRSPMHRMTRNAPAAQVRAPFDGGTFTFKGDRVQFQTAGGERFVTLQSGSDHRVWRVTRVIGGRYREDFAGVEVARAEPKAPALGDASKEWVLPASFVFSTASFRHKGFSVMNPDRPGLKAGPVWNQTCVDCHNTVPYLQVALGALYGRGAPGFQGEVVDAVLPSALRWGFEISDPAALQGALARELAALGARVDASYDTRGLLKATIEATRDRTAAEHLIEIGIGCESCHGGSREHVANPSVAPSYEPRAPFLRSLPPAGVQPTRALDVNRACARCHQVLFSRYPYTWEGGSRTKAPGGSTINSGEARDFLLSRCSSALACTACHDPHTEDRREKLNALATPKGNQVCLGCHLAYREPAALRAHAHHDPNGNGASCVACHMPKKNMGLDYGLTRYHRIGSPADPQRVEHDRPLECALCHPAKGTRNLVETMERWWGKHYDRAALGALYGDLEAPAMRATLERGKPHEQAVAIASLGDAADTGALPALVKALTHPYPLVRRYAKHALEKTTARALPVDLDADEAVLRAQVDAWIRSPPGRDSALLDRRTHAAPVGFTKH